MRSTKTHSKPKSACELFINQKCAFCWHPSIAQMVERQTVEVYRQKSVGHRFDSGYWDFRSYSSVVEHPLSKRKVRGSTPRSSFFVVVL